MFSFRKFAISVLAFGVSAVTIFGALPAIAQSSIAVTPHQLRTLAANAVVEGNPAQSYQMTQALLARDPNDTEALIIQARAARDLGRLDEAKTSARKAWSAADNPSERFGASMVMAQALSTQGAKTRAQLWLRRAAQNAPSEEFKNVAVRDFRYVRSTNPWATEFSFSASPSSNINNGSARSSTKLFDLPFEFQLSGAAQALSGTQYNAGFSTRYRVAENERSQHDLVLTLDHRTYTMSAEAKQLAPTSKGSDFEFSSAGLSYIRRGFSGPGTDLPNQIEISGGRTWYGRAPFMQYAKFGFTQNYVFAPGRFVFGTITREYQNSMSARADLDSWGISGGIRVAMANNDALTLSLSNKKSNSLDPSLDYTQMTLSSRYALAKPIAGVSVNFGLSLSQKSHDISRFSRFGQLDQTVSVDVTGVFKNIEYFGFSPSVTLSASQTNSTIGLYERRNYGLRVGIQSSF